MLKPEHREALLSSVPEALDYYVSNYEQNTTAKFDKAIADESVKQVTFTPEQTAQLNELAASVREDWVKKYQGSSTLRHYLITPTHCLNSKTNFTISS